MRKGWEEITLKEACDLFTDGDWIETKNQSTEGIRLIQTGNIGSGKFKNRKKKARYISEETFKELNCTEVFPGDLLVSRLPDPVGRSCLIPDIGSKMITAVDCTIIRPKRDLLNPEYLMYYQMSRGYYSEIYSKVTGTTRSRISRKNLGKLNISIPPLPEQKRIVDILDEAFGAIDKAKANIERNIENAEELFQSKLNQIFSQRGEDWEELSIEKITNVINGYAFKSKDFSSDNPVKAIKITNVGVQEFVEDIENNLPKDFLDSFSKVKVESGDIVIALTRTIISSGLKVARVPESYDGALVNQRVAALSAKKVAINPTYLYYYLSTDIVTNYVLSNVNTLMQPNLSIRDLKRLKVPVCSVSKQKEITSLIESLRDNVEGIIKAYKKTLGI